MKTVLITGINGFLGSHLAADLKNNFKVVGLTREKTIGNENGVKLYSWESREADRVFSENEIYCVIHCATVYRGDVSRQLETNLLMPVRIFELSQKSGTKVFINTDSFFNVRESRYSYLPEYTLTKRQLLEWLKLKAGSCKVVNMKVFHMYGEKDSPEKFIPSITYKLLNNEIEIDLTSGEQKRDFIYIEDVVKAFRIIMEENLTENFTEYEVGTGVSTSIKELVELLKELTHSKTELNFGAIPYRENEFEEIIADNSKLKKSGWESEHSLRSGLARMIDKLKRD